MPRCSICREYKREDEMVGDICQDCSLSKLEEDDLNIGRDNFS